jgi:hypothetical protein
VISLIQFNSKVISSVSTVVTSQKGGDGNNVGLKGVNKYFKQFGFTYISAIIGAIILFNTLMTIK